MHHNFSKSRPSNSTAERAANAPTIRRIFASSPRDPRYHMLEHLSTKFKTAPESSIREPRAALILNRFTRTLTVMYATNAVSNILGVTADQINGKSFYECIQVNCLEDAIRCLESAKANDSIAYLRFWYRDPRRPEELDQLEREASGSSDSEDGGVELGNHVDMQQNQATPVPNQLNSNDEQPSSMDSRPRGEHYTSSGGSTDLEHDSASATSFGEQPSHSHGSSSSSAPLNLTTARANIRTRVPRRESPTAPIEIEAVVSCTSDGLVVILRRARPMLPQLAANPVPQYTNGLFAAPWGANPIMPRYQPEAGYAFRAEHLPAVQAAQAHAAATGGPSMDDFMNSIREVAVFAWSLTGINGNIANYGHGIAMGEAVPSDGFPIWDPHAQGVSYNGPENQAYQKWVELHRAPNDPALGAQIPYPHARQAQLVRQQMGYGNGPMGTDLPGSAARAYLGSYIGDDGRGPGYFPNEVSQNYHRDQVDQGDQHMGGTDSADARDQEQSPSNGHSGDRYLWY